MNSFRLFRTLWGRRLSFNLRFWNCFLCFLGKHFRFFLFSIGRFCWWLLRLFSFLIFFLYSFCFLSWLFFIFRSLLDRFPFDFFGILFDTMFLTLTALVGFLFNGWCILDNFMILGPLCEFVEFRLGIQDLLRILRAYLTNCSRLLRLLFLLTFLHKTE